MGGISEGGGDMKQIHPLFQEVEGYKLSDFIPPDSLHLLVDLSQEVRISAVEKAIRRRMDPQKDEELLHWFRLLKRVYALVLIGGSGISAEMAEKHIIPTALYNFSEERKMTGTRYRTHLKQLYVELPDAFQEGLSVTPVFALPKTKTWILAEIADGWNPEAYPVEDQLDCLLFLSMAADGPVYVWNHPHARAFVNRTSTYNGWKEVRKCVRDLLRERAEKYEAKELASFLQNSYLKKTVRTCLWHAFIAKMMERAGDVERLQALLSHISW